MAEVEQRQPTIGARVTEGQATRDTSAPMAEPEPIPRSPWVPAPGEAHLAQQGRLPFSRQNGFCCRSPEFCPQHPHGRSKTTQATLQAIKLEPWANRSRAGHTVGARTALGHGCAHLQVVQVLLGDLIVEVVVVSCVGMRLPFLLVLLSRRRRCGHCWLWRALRGRLVALRPFSRATDELKKCGCGTASGMEARSPHPAAGKTIFEASNNGRADDVERLGSLMERRPRSGAELVEPAKRRATGTVRATLWLGLTGLCSVILAGCGSSQVGPTPLHMAAEGGHLNFACMMLARSNLEP